MRYYFFLFALLLRLLLKEMISETVQWFPSKTLRNSWACKNGSNVAIHARKYLHYLIYKEYEWVMTRIRDSIVDTKETCTEIVYMGNDNEIACEIDDWKIDALFLQNYFILCNNNHSLQHSWETKHGTM